MHKFMAFAAAVSAYSGVAAAQSVSIAANQVSDGNMNNSFAGQSFYVSGNSDFNNITFYFQNSAGQNVGAGKLYLFNHIYDGAPINLAYAAGVLGVGSFSSGLYRFAPNLVLSSGSTYFAYADTSFIYGISLDTYAGGQTFAAFDDGLGSPIPFLSFPSIDTRFGVTGSLVPPAVTPSVPEPATWAMMIVGFSMAGYAMRRRSRAVVRFA